MCTGLLFGLIVTIITSLATGGYPEDQIDSSLVHSWSIDFFKWLKAKSGISKISHTSASSYNFELKSAGMAGSKSSETMYPTAASTETLVTRVVADYAVFFGSLVAALAIGIWQAVKYRHDSQKDMLVISSGMHLVPITLSLMATYLSAILILGTPAEIYANGSEWTTSILGFLIGIPLATVVFVPIFYKLKLTSVNEYFELRFRSKAVRILGSFLFLAQNLLYMGVALWAPVIAISSVTSMPEWVAILTAGGICTIYTAVGGLRAVVWTDAFQVVVMFLGLLVIIVYGTIQVGGAGEVWRIASENDRANFFKTLMLNVPGVIILVLMACIAGLVLFANYVHCDPLKAGIIKSKDQIIPFFVVDQLGDLSGLPGLFMSCLFSGALR
ncbi:unnamed protein product [Notodromas monacha]|uniref:Sodium-dependent multivitamin transporter n=1 Tax=Notodromas monacha TaxID=399045 RepID=A0A7R9C0W4_9CRUS|nr:unnamed protein product [Notodromas monacha]CAG0924109.1 unnamed protein product [Notodromas monacha]